MDILKSNFLWIVRAENAKSQVAAVGDSVYNRDRIKHRKKEH